MGYKIAVASTDGLSVNAHFGSSVSYFIYEVNDEGGFHYIEERVANRFNTNTCGSGSGCDNKSGNCGGHSDANIESRIALIEDCRSLLCSRVGTGAARQLERKAIITFEIDFQIENALKKVADYFFKIDNHISLRNREL